MCYNQRRETFFYSHLIHILIVTAPHLPREFTMTSKIPGFNRRQFVLAVTATASAQALLSNESVAREFGPGSAPTRYPDPDVVAIDDEFKKYTQGNAAINRLYHSPKMIWAEGCAWNGVGRYLLWSDIPNNTQLRWLEEDGHVSTFRNPAQNSNGNTFDTTGRQISCEHLTRAVARYEYDGTRTVLTTTYGGKSLNAPNDAVVHPATGDIFFTDPGYGGLMDFEGRAAENKDNWPQPYQKEAIYRIDAKTTKVHKLTDDIYKPNGLCFSPDYKSLYVADTGASHYEDAPRNIKVWDVVGQTELKNGREYASMMLDMTDDAGNTQSKGGFADGIRADVAGNIWASAGWVGEGYDGVHIFNPQGKRIGQILLPEICANVCFGGTKRNQLFMCGSTSLYSVYVGTRGAHFC
jgi:gluconolactonase